MPLRELIKIVVLGPESTGKSTLSELLAQHYNTQWCPEYAREYLHTNGASYSFDDLLLIAKGQLAMEDQYIQSALSGRKQGDSHSPLLFIDTNMYVMKVWCEFVFGNCHQWILEQIVKREYDLYLLCNTDLPWVKDDLREYPDIETRNRQYRVYKDLMINQATPWEDISGDYNERLQKAIKAIDRLIAR